MVATNVFDIDAISNTVFPSTSCGVESLICFHIQKLEYHSGVTIPTTIGTEILELKTALML